MAYDSGWRNERWRNNQPAWWQDERAAQQEDDKRICKNQLQAIQLSGSGNILKEEFPLWYLYGEAPFLVKVSKVGCHQMVLIVLCRKPPRDVP